MPTLHLDIILHKALQALKFTAISQSKLKRELKRKHK